MPATIYKVISSINCAKKFTWTLTLAFEKTLWREYYAAAAAAKSLQSCPTLCDPIDGSPPGCPWDCPGKNTRVSCHFLLQCMKVKSEREVAQSCPTLSDPMNCSLPGFLHPWDFPGKSTGVGCHCLLRESRLRAGYCSI